jgi:hypothetical protein
VCVGGDMGTALQRNTILDPYESHPLSLLNASMPALVRTSAITHKVRRGSGRQACMRQTCTLCRHHMLHPASLANVCTYCVVCPPLHCSWFASAGPEVYANHNAPPAVAYSAIIYALRCLVKRDIPLNQGCLAPVTIHIPPACLLNPSPEAAVVSCTPVVC